jgi:hypothetical protein
MQKLIIKSIEMIGMHIIVKAITINLLINEISQLPNLFDKLVLTIPMFSPLSLNTSDKLLACLQLHPIILFINKYVIF